MVLGLGHQQVWARGGHDDVHGDVPDPESLKWKRGIDAVGTPPPGVRWVHAGDGESDCWEAIESCVRNGCGFALRACQDRLVLAGHAEEASAGRKPVNLFDLLRGRSMFGGKHLYVRSRPGRAARWAKLAISACAVTVLAPKNWSDKSHRKGRPRPGPISTIPRDCSASSRRPCSEAPTSATRRRRSSRRRSLPRPLDKPMRAFPT